MSIKSILSFRYGVKTITSSTWAPPYADIDSSSISSCIISWASHKAPGLPQGTRGDLVRDKGWAHWLGGSFKSHMFSCDLRYRDLKCLVGSEARWCVRLSGNMTSEPTSWLGLVWGSNNGGAGEICAVSQAFQDCWPDCLMYSSEHRCYKLRNYRAHGHTYFEPGDMESSKLALSSTAKGWVPIWLFQSLYCSPSTLACPP